MEQLEAEALNLPVSERARLAQRLLVSLDEAKAEDPKEVERAWEEEIRLRLDAYRDGKGRPIPAAEVLTKARSRLR